MGDRPDPVQSAGQRGAAVLPRHDAVSRRAYGHSRKAALERAEIARQEEIRVDWYSIVFEVIDMRSFSNLWFWIVLAVVWSSASHWVLGVPYDMVARARRHGGQAETDLEDLVRINTNRVLFIVDEAGLWLAAIGPGALSALALLGFLYDIELAQALFMLAFPLSLVGLLSIATARRIQRGEGQGEALWRRLRIHRIMTQAIGMVSIFVTALYGMYQNLSAHVL